MRNPMAPNQGFRENQQLACRGQTKLADHRSTRSCPRGGFLLCARIILVLKACQEVVSGPAIRLMLSLSGSQK